MRVANVAGRLSLVVSGDGGGDVTLDVEELSTGRFASDPQAVFDVWDEFLSWARPIPAADGARATARPLDPDQLGAPVPAPRQVFAIGLNYRDHATESGFDEPDGDPPVFTKFQSAITGPAGVIEIPAGGKSDWEVELVVVIGRRAFEVQREHAMEHVAGFAVGQDLSERGRQMAAKPPQFSLGKSLPRFGPIGPWLTTLDELGEGHDPHDLELGCRVSGQQMQLARTSELIFSVPVLIEKLSSACPLLPGDVIFSGTPAGVGAGMKPPRWLADGDELVTHIEGLGEMRHVIATR